MRVFEEMNCKTASDHFTSFSFSIKSMNRLDFIICWFSLYIIAEQSIKSSIKIFFNEIKLGNKVKPHNHIAPNAHFITYLNEKHVKWSEAVLQFRPLHLLMSILIHDRAVSLISRLMVQCSLSTASISDISQECQPSCKRPSSHERSLMWRTHGWLGP